MKININSNKINQVINAEKAIINENSKSVNSVNERTQIDHTENNIYFSYAWGDKNEISESREELVNKLYDTLIAKNYKVVRDKMDLTYRGLISEFMQEIGRGRLIIVATSDKYLKSPYCMFELYGAQRTP